VSAHFGNTGQAAHRATAAREEDRQARAERAEAEGYFDQHLPDGMVPDPETCEEAVEWGQMEPEDLNAMYDASLREPQHRAGDPFCECADCRGKRKK